ncbi:HAD family hydrolase [Microbacterium telephonicum]|uniref:FMN phosphatase YigB (HAD superfamily) n=1 Tax=Microbacterium telephonicum TaxID=1714841 RepID=A0A498CJS4_9MICO|nr:HAD family hydrolase [Microbacterium telephonicum]RLK52451.1 FMN phosphatase YigB (HAD superfamily) [Microbacterium telephonicum]
MTPTIILDFDGTVALGLGPIEAFARAVGAAAADAGFAPRAMTAIAEFEDGRGAGRDGYDVVSTLAAAQGVSPEALEAAYQSSRALLGSADAPVSPPDRLAAFLTRVGAHADVVLATNAPGAGIRSLLDAWGVADAFTAMHFTVGKPAGLTAIVRDALQRGPVLSVGDIEEFDLRPAAALGADTALVGATAARSTAEVTLRGRTLADLYDRIEAWAAAAHAAASPAS